MKRVCAVLAVVMLVGSDVVLRGAEPPAALVKMVREDWAAHEAQLGRTLGDAAALDSVLSRTEILIASWNGKPDAPELSQEIEQLAAFRSQQTRINSLDNAASVTLYEQARWLARDVALKHPSIVDKPMLFVKQRRFVCQMLHEFLGYYYDYGGISGGGVYVLTQPGKSLETQCLTEHQLSRGNFASPALSFDARTIYFAFCPVQDRSRPHGSADNWKQLPPADKVPAEFSWDSTNRSSFHIYAMNVDGTNLHQLTDGLFDDFDPCPLPNGQIAFMSSRRGGYCRCNNAFEPIPTYTLHTMNDDGTDIVTLSWHETNEWNPSMLHDGRIIYSRWDYVDRSAAHFHGLWVNNQDGSGLAALFGNYTMDISACYQPRAVLQSRKIAFIVGAHHTPIGGSLVLFDPDKAEYDAVTGEDSFVSLERLTPEVCFPETSEGWPSTFYSHPHPLSEDHFLVAYSYHPLPGYGGKYLHDSLSGIYYFDRFGNRELLYRDADISCVAPMMLAPREVPPVIPSQRDSDLAADNAGEMMLSDVKQSFFPLPSDRLIKSLRIFQVYPKAGSHIANAPRIGHANAEIVRAVLGDVPVEPDGSAFFRAPAGVSLYFQAIDADGRAVQSMRSATYIQPGERRSCTGCHEPISSPPPGGNTARLAMSRPASEITPGPDGSRPMSFARLVQPVLDKHCVACHDGTQAQTQHNPPLVGTPQKQFTVSYNALLPYIRFYEWGDRSISQIVTKPGECGADQSRLLDIISDDNHRNAVKLTPEERQRLVLWLDANIPFYGTFDPEMQFRQRLGETVPLPELE